MKSKNKKQSAISSGRHFIMAIIIITVIMAVIPFLLIRSYQREEREKQASVIFISKRLDESNDFWSLMVEGVQMAAAEYNIDLTMMGPKTESDIAGQNKMIEKAISQKPDAIALAPSDFTETIPYAEKIEAAGIKLILLDSVMEKEIGVCVAATDNYKGGRKMGSYLKDYADESSVIGIVGHSPTASTAIDREKGVRSGLEQYEEQIAEVVYCYSDEQKAYDVTLAMLKRHPDMNMIAGLNEDSAVGAGRAVRDAGLTGKIRMIGFDSSMEQVQMLEEGIFSAIVIQKPFSMGYLGIQAANQAIRGEKLSSEIDSGSVLITKDTIYTKENEKLLFPFRQSE